MRRLGLLLAVGTLCGCAGSTGFLAADRDWPAWAADVYAMPDAERQALHAQVADEYAERGGADVAIRLAILTATPDASEQDLGAALDLLDTAESGLGSGAGSAGRSRDFIALLRPFLLALQSERAALTTESLARELLEEQLEELKALEESLNASATDR